MQYKKITVYTKDYCPFCHRVLGLFKDLSIPCENIDVTHDEQRFDFAKQKSGMRTVPQVFIGDECIGGCDETFALHKQGKLATLCMDA